MGLNQRFYAKTVYVDTSPFIYYVEEKPEFNDSLTDFFHAVENGQLRVMTSSMTLLEVLIVPIRLEQTVLVNEYNAIFRETSDIDVYPFDNDIARIAASLRAGSSLKTPDAIHLATALHHKADYFLTNDKRLEKIPGTEVVLLPDL